MVQSIDLVTLASVVTALVALCAFIYQISRNFGTKLDAVSRTLATAIEAAKVENNLRIEKLEISESAKRHDDRNTYTAQMLKYENEINRLQRETVRKEELTNLEVRMNNILAKIEVKLDGITDRMADWKVIESKIKDINDQFERIANKFYDNNPNNNNPTRTYGG